MKRATGDAVNIPLYPIATVLIYSGAGLVQCVTEEVHYLIPSDQHSKVQRGFNEMPTRVPCFLTSHSDFKRMECKEVWIKRGLVKLSQRRKDLSGKKNSAAKRTRKIEPSNKKTVM